MAPSTDQFLHYIYGKGDAASLMLMVVNAALVSAMLLLGCSFCKKYRTKEVNLIKQRAERPNSELRRVIVHKDNGIQKTTGMQNGATAMGTEGNFNLTEEANVQTTSVRLKNGAVLSSIRGELDKTSPLMNRGLPLPPENVGAAPPAAEMEDPLYETVKELNDEVMETRRRTALSNKKEATSISEAIKVTDLENQEPLKLERINPLYVSAEEVKGSPFYREATSDIEKDEAGETQAGTDPLYAVIHKEPSVKNPPTRNPGGEKSTVKASGLQKVALPEELSSVDQTVHLVTYKEQKPPYPESPAEKVDSMLTYWKKKSVKFTLSPKEDMTVNVIHEVPPPVPVKLFDLESDTIEEEIAGELPT
ncbi:uncharacterized protein [Eleutherodactylus coqui]|uniref:uncharacterized protein n=1 Tax=Eleutherodactylus coqui TaxID=57060 RepID=UPI003462196B